MRLIALLVILGGGVLPDQVAGQSTDNAELRQAIAAYDEGEMQRALNLLQSTPALMNAHDSAVRSLYLGLVYFALGDRARAQDAFARAVRTEPPLRVDPTIHSPSRVQAFEEARTAVLEEWRRGAQQADAENNEEESLRLWRAVLAASPEDEQANGRVAAILEAQRVRSDTAARSRADSLAREQNVRVTDTEPRIASDRLYDPGRAFALGLAVPGLGQMYAGRGLRGVLVLAGAGGALAAGYLSERENVNCRTEPVDNVCPAGDILDRDTERPYMGAALAAAAGITLIGAIDALLSARRSNAEVERATGSGSNSGVQLLAPNVSAHGDQVRAEILRLRFR